MEPLLTSGEFHRQYTQRKINWHLRVRATNCNLTLRKIESADVIEIELFTNKFADFPKILKGK